MIVSLKQRGDTLVEVLIAIAVLAAVLGGAYVSANRSLQTTRQTQERGEALKFAESQLEKLRATPSAALPTGSFCFTGGSGVASTSTPCVETFGGGVSYNAVITRDASSGFIVRVEWASIRGTGNDNVEIRYRTE